MNQTDIQLIPIHPEQKETLRNLYSLYLHDLSQYTQELKIHEDGTYHFEGFEWIFRNPRLQSYLIYQGEQLIGFITLVETKTKEEVDYIINDLFIVHKGKRQRNCPKYSRPSPFIKGRSISCLSVERKSSCYFILEKVPLYKRDFL